MTLFSVELSSKSLQSITAPFDKNNPNSGDISNRLMKNAAIALEAGDYIDFDQSIIQLGEVIHESYKISKHVDSPFARLDTDRVIKNELGYDVDETGTKIGKVEIFKLNVMGQAIDESFRSPESHINPIRLKNLNRLRAVIANFNDGKFSTKLREKRQEQIDGFENIKPAPRDPQSNSLEATAISDKEHANLREKNKKLWNTSTRHFYRYGLQLLTLSVDLDIQNRLDEHKTTLRKRLGSQASDAHIEKAAKEAIRLSLLKTSYFGRESSAKKADDKIFEARQHYKTKAQIFIKDIALILGYLFAIGCGISVTAECLALIGVPFIAGLAVSLPIITITLITLIAAGAFPAVYVSNTDVAKGIMPKIFIDFFGRDKFFETMAGRPKTIRYPLYVLSLIVGLSMAALTWNAIATDIVQSLALAFPAFFHTGGLLFSVTSVIFTVAAPIIAVGTFFTMAAIVANGWKTISKNPVAKVKAFFAKQESTTHRIILGLTAAVVLAGLAALFFVCGSFGIAPFLAASLGLAKTSAGVIVASSVLAALGAVGMGPFYMIGTVNVVSRGLKAWSKKQSKKRNDLARKKAGLEAQLEEDHTKSIPGHKLLLYVTNAVYNALLLLKTLLTSTIGTVLSSIGFVASGINSFGAILDNSINEIKDHETKEKGSADRMSQFLGPNYISDLKVMKALAKSPSRLSNLREELSSFLGQWKEGKSVTSGYQSAKGSVIPDKGYLDTAIDEAAPEHKATKTHEKATEINKYTFEMIREGLQYPPRSSKQFPGNVQPPATAAASPASRTTSVELRRRPPCGAEDSVPLLPTGAQILAY